MTPILTKLAEVLLGIAARYIADYFERQFKKKRLAEIEKENEEKAKEVLLAKDRDEASDAFANLG